MTRLLVAAIVVAGLVPATVHAASPVPPPPPPPNCGYCPGPPAPPTLVPTLAPTVLPVQGVVDVHLAQNKVARGAYASVSIAASTGDHVSLTVQYHDGKPKAAHSRVGPSGVLQHRWKVPSSAALGKARLQVEVTDSGDTLSRTLWFTVVR